MQVLILHGLLHLAGYDHEADEGQMARQEAALRRHFGLAMGLIERSSEAVKKEPVQKKAHPRRSRKP